MSNHCQSLGQKLNDWRLAIDELKLAKDAYLANFSDSARDDYQAKKNEAVRLQKEYAELLERIYETYETVEIDGKEQKLFGLEYEALRRIYDGCGIGFLEKGVIELENGRIISFSLYNLFSREDTDDIIQVRTQAFKNIRYFKHLKRLDCGNNNLAELDVRENKELLSLYCSGNSLTDLDVSKNKELQWLYCSDNSLYELDVRENKELRWLYCYGNSLTDLDVRDNKELRWLDCRFNFLSPANIRQIQALGISQLTIFPQYPVEILDFLTKLKSEEPNLPLDQAITKLNEFYETSEVQSKLTPEQIVIPNKQETERIVRGFLKK